MGVSSQFIRYEISSTLFSAEFSRDKLLLKGIKHECYVFDFNPNRSLSMLYELAKAQANTGDPKPILNEMLKSALMSYPVSGNRFQTIDASDLIAKFRIWIWQKYQFNWTTKPFIRIIF